MEISLVPLLHVDKSEIIALMNDPMVRKYLPLATDAFDQHAYERFINAKKELWDNYGYGPWALLADGNFAGWGGLQPEDGVPDIALVLKPDYWGTGVLFYKAIINYGFDVLGFKTISALLPEGRIRQQALIRLGFERKDQFEINGYKFNRYILSNIDTHK